MPQNGLLLSPNNSKAAVYDKDAINYFSRAGVTNATAKSQINAFVKGVKNLGLYNSMICWPLRSAQNAGTGTTAYSLGGIGIYNATLTNGPTWGTNEISLDGVNDSFSAVLPELQTNTIICVGNYVTAVNGILFSLQKQGLVYNTINRFCQQAYDFNGFNGFYSNPTTFTFATIATSVGLTRSFFGAGYKSTGFQVFNRNSVSSASFTLPALPVDRLLLAARQDNSGNPEVFAKSAFSFCLVLSSEISMAQRDSIYSLYKTTLGQGLGLP
jgi:hypothetical protein